MGNYKNLESEFIERTLSLIRQYYDLLDQFEYKRQFNYTLTINCLLGLIVMPKERVISFIPNDRLTSDFKNEIGLENSIINEEIKTLRDLIKSLRHSIAHFDIEVISENENNNIDWINFNDTQDEGKTVAQFRSNEILPFLEYYCKCLNENLERNKN
jgi:hypothetical protein